MKINQHSRVQSGFTLLEILLVVAAIAILAGIVILAINPTKQLGDTRNAQRRIDVNTIINAVYQYFIDTGNLPGNISVSTSCPGDAANEICKTSASSCGLYVDLSDLTTDQKYVPSIPTDPSITSDSVTGYFITRSANSRVTVCAPQAESGATITVTR